LPKPQRARQFSKWREEVDAPQVQQSDVGTEPEAPRSEFVTE